ncbi:glutamate synthase-related protein [Denitratisoma oestradiolicum]|uniref:Glutamate synthase [NADPH] large chain n=1 Tax=Denitratisoma oestradiolicum TaxID=311182 RepID=A0A6S6XUX5_9PROT|nr:glutamate synthase-related protein [Denitratisoma oestradiolicum]TWO80019.1 glutamate synthase subunit alpha [Denitratisoma oestradiolicum]CAB1369787.1 glutamate synthase, large subunit [Denitratisoma oestradiolicum]
MDLPSRQGLYDPAHEHDACGVGFVAHIKNKKSHAIVEQGLAILKNLEHRGATGFDPKLGDGAGILIQLPDAFLREETKKAGFALPVAGAYAVGNIFLPQSANGRAACESAVARIVCEEGQTFLGWRDVPRDNSGLADSARDIEPVIRQAFIGRGESCADQNAFERKLFVIRKRIEHEVRRLHIDDRKMFYIGSLSSRTIVYKGMLLSWQVGEYFRDLQDPRMVSALALVHQRFSTNTFPTWDLAHPFRMIAHNGEINTLRGNVNWMAARQKAMDSSLLGEDLDKLWPLIVEGQSDSACFDNALELLVMGGYSLAHAMMMLIPEAWAGNPLMDEERRAFYEFHAPVMEPWDGPAAVAFTDGRQIGATLDRNGLRPARYLITEDDIVMMASEMGVLTFPEKKIVKKWRLQPGKMFMIDLEQGRIIDDAELKKAIATQEPYGKWTEESRIFLADLPAGKLKSEMRESLLDTQQAFGYTQEDIKFVLEPMTAQGEEATGSMGNDAALPVLSSRNKSLYVYFKQLFAQVTNPPIDPIREEIVMSLTSFVGPKPNLMGIANVDEPLTPRLELHQPVLLEDDIARLRNIDKLTKGRFKSLVLDMTYPAGEGAEGCEAAIARLCAAAERSVADGYNVLILSDRAISRDAVAIPALLATSGVHHHLTRKGLRTSTGLVVDTGSVREVHHIALLAGYGAEAVSPWLALETIKSFAGKDYKDAHKRYVKAVGKGLNKVMSKMGISTYQSYCGAQIFEAIGLNAAFVAKYFTGTATQVEGIGLREVAEEAVRVHRSAFSDDPVLENMLDAGGEYALRVRGEEHMWTTDSIAKLQHATRSGKYETYKEYARIINDQSKRHMTLRGLFEIKAAGPAVPLEEVESAKEIVKRFATGAMSLGSISTEAHSTLAIAMNRIGGKSNTGEGGEDPMRFKPVKGGQTVADLIGKGRIERDLELKDGDSLRSAIKQVASGRFGVTAEYLANADQIQIKMAQGAKPGEGGQLPGHKVSEYIGFLRHSVPGVGLISPPPHHDIYSIEDLAQLIHDLKNANSQASISVKLVSEVGVGTVAAGVAKAKADHVVIAGHDGGTGASPISSIKHAGTPWELGLAETQQTLVLNRLRGRIRVQADGQMKTGRDVLIGALLGADEFGFATAPLVVEGCIMMRKCHLNTCPVGVATQDPELRKRFTGQPEHVVNYFFFVAEELRELMAQIGIRKFDDLIGRADLLDTRQGIEHWKAQGLNFSKIFHMPPMPAGVARCHRETQDHGLDKALDHKLVQEAARALENGKPVVINTPISNVNRTCGTLLSHEVARRYGSTGLPNDTIHVRLTGTAGQSFGAFLARGITMDLVGEGNDYVGKGLSGGRIIVRPPKDFRGVPTDNIIVGNTVLYGATEGEAYFRGVAGERFAVRNSGATTVVEGTGDHGCEYMTGGTVVVLGQTGRNFAAGMSGGVAYVLDEDGNFEKRCNLAMVALEPVPEEIAASETGELEGHGRVDVRHLGRADEDLLKSLIAKHAEYTDSERARDILAHWPQYRSRFVKVMPHEYRRALKEMAEQQQKEAA